MNNPPMKTQSSTPMASSVGATVSSRMKTRDQNWRGKYLRALNICPTEVEVSQAKATQKTKLRSFSYRSDVDAQSMSRSYSSSTDRDEDANEQGPAKMFPSPVRRPRPTHDEPMTMESNSARHVAFSQQSMTNPYPFTLKPGISRGRRCHTDPFVLEERVSAPIQIPTLPAANNNQVDGNLREDSNHSSQLDRRRARVSSMHNHHETTPQLFSWEEPVAMLAAANAVSKGWSMPEDDVTLGVGRHSDCYGEGGHEEDFGEMQDDDDHDDEIFQMEELDSDGSTDSDQQHPKALLPQPPRSRRRDRTASLNVLQNGREKRTMLMRGPRGDTMQQLPQSFVPPHQLVQRDCFSIGLRDEFKRRPRNNI